MRGEHLSFTLPQNLQSFLANGNNYALKTISSEGNYDRDSAMTVLRADGHYKFDDTGFKRDFGVRRGERTAENTNFASGARCTKIAVRGWNVQPTTQTISVAR